ncbi:MAG TPA: hypothetical protein VIL08_01350 [Limnochorda sp.]
MAPPSPEERMQILKMLQEGRITAEQAGELLDALEAAPPAKESRRPPHSPRFLRVVAYEGSAAKINVNVPLDLVRVLSNLIPREVLKVRRADGEHVLDVDAILRAVEEGAAGKIIEVEGDDSRVEVFVD